MMATLEEITSKIDDGQFDDARQSLARVSESDENRTDLMFLRGRLQEADYDRSGAAEIYEKVLDADADHLDATFRLAWLAEQYGDDERAFELYERCTMIDRVHVNALINLALIHEDRGALADAKRCLESVLNEHPNHFRANHFLKSVKATQTMVYDDRSQVDKDMRHAVLDQPISDFELSVRSRNCLKQMDIHTIGDLLSVTETELLSYKNFGETSLNEIKTLLTQAGLELGHGSGAAPGEPLLPPATPQVELDDPSLALRHVSELDLSVRARKCLQRLGVNTLGDLVQHSEAELMATKNFGQTSLDEIQQLLVEKGLSLRRSGPTTA